MVGIIVALFVLGLVLISFELIIPGGILGLLGMLSIFGSWGLSFYEFGTHGGLLAILSGLVVLGVVLGVELKLLPRTRIGRRLFLDRSVASTSQRPLATPDVVGKEGEALTALGPTGVVTVEGRNYEGFSMSGFVEKGSRLQVVDFDNFRVRVKKI